MEDDLTALDAAELETRLAGVRDRMRPLENQLVELRAERDVLLTELRRRERLAHRENRAGVKAAMRSGELPTMADFVEGAEAGSFDDQTYNLKTGGEVRLGFPGAAAQSVAFTDGRSTAQARDLADAARLFKAGWEMGTPGRPGLRVHFPGTRQERVVPASEVFVRQRPR